MNDITEGYTNLGNGLYAAFDTTTLMLMRRGLGKWHHLDLTQEQWKAVIAFIATQTKDKPNDLS